MNQLVKNLFLQITSFCHYTWCIFNHFPLSIVKLILNTLYSINILKISATDFFLSTNYFIFLFFCIYFVFKIICEIAAVLHEEKKPNKTLCNKQQGPPNQSCPIHRSHRWLEMSTELSCVYCLLLNTLNRHTKVKTVEILTFKFNWDFPV